MPMGWEREPRTTTAPTKQRGFALVVVLWAGALLAMLAAAIAHRAREDVVLTRNLVDATDAELAADSGLQYALERVLNEGSELFLGTHSVQPWEFNGAEVRISVTDETARIDLNAATEQLITNLFAAAGADPDSATALAAGVVAYRRRNASDSFRTLGRPPVGFLTTEELRKIDGMTRPLFDRLYDAITVFTSRKIPRSEHAVPLVRAAMAGDDPEDATGVNIENRSMSAAEQRDLTTTNDAQRRPLGNHILRFHVEARTKGGSVYAREAIVVIKYRPVGASHYIRVWRRGQRRLF